ncbi:MAG: amidohydrolase family protein [Bacillota bacterium]|nr:amidohydrolase family protein [Bacillota bacterium]
MFDILIKGGRVIDGTGNAWFRADVGIQDGRVVAVASGLEGPALRTIDASGRVVTPGVVDIHSHTDRTIYQHPKAETAVKQGITTTGVGHCGGSSAPHRTAVPGEDWVDFASFFCDVESKGLGINIAQCIGHGSVRALVMGPEGSGGERPDPTAEELEQMKTAVAQGMADGCFGLTTGLQYPPGRNAKTGEVVELMKAASPGLYMTHMREQTSKIVDGVNEAIEVTEKACCKGVISHLKVAGPEQWGWSSKILKQIEDARAREVDIQFDVYPWRYSGIGYLHRNVLPPWVCEGGPQGMLSLLRNPAARERIRQDIAVGIPGWTNSAKLRGWANHTIVYSTNPDLYEVNIQEFADHTGRDPVDAVCDLVIQDEGLTRTCRNSMSDADVKTLLAHPLAIVSTDSTATDGTPKGAVHPRNIGSYPQVFGYYVREQHVLPLEDAVRKCSSAPAAALGIHDRGVIRLGAWADILVFDPQTIAYPGTYADPVHSPVGLDVVIVNGRVAVENGVHTGALAGKVLRRQG